MICWRQFTLKPISPVGRPCSTGDIFDDDDNDGFSTVPPHFQKQHDKKCLVNEKTLKGKGEDVCEYFLRNWIFGVAS